MTKEAIIEILVSEYKAMNPHSNTEAIMETPMFKSKLKHYGIIADKILALQPTEEEIEKGVKYILKNHNPNKYPINYIKCGINWFKNFKRERSEDGKNN